VRTILRVVCPRHGRVCGLIQRAPDGRLWLNENGRQLEGELVRLTDSGAIGVRCPRCQRGYQEVYMFAIREAISEGSTEVFI
jgi:hypothetical protein